MPWKVFKDGERWCVHKLMEDDEMGERVPGGCHPSEEEATRHMRALYMHAEEMRSYFITEFRGDYPDIPLAASVNVEELKALDDSPMFVTLPIIPEVGAISENGLLYDEALVTSIERQINDKRPGGGFGHLKEDDRPTAFPLPQALWVGAKRVGQTLWAKAYIPPGAAREYIRTLKAVGGRIATSIYGPGTYEAVKEGVLRLTDFTLESLDFAPPERAALRFGAMPIITAETISNSTEDNMSKEQLIAELTAKDIPQSLRDAIVKEWQVANKDKGQIAELAQQRDDALTLVKELQGQIDKYKAAEFGAELDGQIAELIDWNVNGDEAKKKLDAFQRTLRSRIVTEIGDKRKPDEVKVTIDAVWEEMKPLAEIMRDALAGPPARVNGRVRDSHKLDDTPEARRAARARVGL